MSAPAADPQPTTSHFIDGACVEDTSGTPIDVIFPATGEVIARVHAATPAIVKPAVAAARKAQVGWARLTGSERGRILRRAADIMRERNHDLSVLETLDTGKPLQETSVADATSGADAFEYFGAIAAGLTGSHIPLTGGDLPIPCASPGRLRRDWRKPSHPIACWKGARSGLRQCDGVQTL